MNESGNDLINQFITILNSFFIPSMFNCKDHDKVNTVLMLLWTLNLLSTLLMMNNGKTISVRLIPPQDHDEVKKNSKTADWCVRSFPYIFGSFCGCWLSAAPWRSLLSSTDASLSEWSLMSHGLTLHLQEPQLRRIKQMECEVRERHLHKFNTQADRLLHSKSQLMSPEGAQWFYIQC